jgi:hypothetical protein
VNNSNVSTFTAGQPAVAADVNSTFQALIAAINDNATRIAALEVAAPSIDVAGKTFSLRSIISEVAVGENPNDADGQVYNPAGGNDFVNISNGAAKATISFSGTGGGGTVVLESDKYFEANIPGNKFSDFTDVNETDIVTFVQVGNAVTVNFPDGGLIEFLVAANGTMLISAVSELETDAQFDDGSNGEASYVELLIGVQDTSQ